MGTEESKAKGSWVLPLDSASLHFTTVPSCDLEPAIPLGLCSSTEENIGYHLEETVENWHDPDSSSTSPKSFPKEENL